MLSANSPTSQSGRRSRWAERWRWCSRSSSAWSAAGDEFKRRAQRLVHGFGIAEGGCNIGVENDDLAARLEARRVLVPHPLAEVVLGRMVSRSRERTLLDLRLGFFFIGLPLAAGG
ncbi:MAG: hypothetical protein H0T58_12380 [Gemmatimonadales bacterium]|nr:hypothetical protein [Gemmatimonadales bacterium]